MLDFKMIDGGISLLKFNGDVTTLIADTLYMISEIHAKLATVSPDCAETFRVGITQMLIAKSDVVFDGKSSVEGVMVAIPYPDKPEKDDN